ncbi:MAG: four helix bundle protein [Bacteroidales bacterium]
MVPEAEYGQSKAGSISKWSISLKESNECDYWISLLKDSAHITNLVANDLLHSIEQITKILISSANTAKNNLQKYSLIFWNYYSLFIIHCIEK